MIYNWHHLRQLVLPAQAQTIYKSLQLHPTGWTPETGFQAVHIWLQSVTETGASTPELPMILPRISYIYIYSCVCVCVYVYVCVYIQLFYTSVIPSGYGMVQCDNQWFGIPPINGHPAFQCESVTPLQQPSLMLACLVTSHSRKSASAGKRIPCSPSSRHWGGVWLAIPIQYSDSFQRETYRPIYIYIHSSAQLLLILICGWATQQKKWESLGMTVPFSRNQESLRTCFTHKKTTLKPWALSPMPMIGTCKRTENTLW